jgi:two-component system OmpR family response regulator
MFQTQPIHHILVVEDEQHLAYMIKFNLQAEGYQVTAVTDGQSALDALEEAQPPIDLVVLDIMLPGMSGYGVCQNLRERGTDIPILMLSARTLSEDRTRGFDVGADQYLSKPFDLDELLSRIKGLLNRHRQLVQRRGPHESLRNSAHEIVRFAGARINFDTHEVLVNQQPVKMTPMELRLVKYFWDHEGRVISRQELLENVWDLPGDVRTRAVDQFLRRLRKVFEPDPAEPRHFLTLRDAGYRFVAEPDLGS